MKRVVIFGATSAIANATARIWAERGYRIMLVGRNASHLERIAQDLEVRGAEQLAVQVADLNDLDLHDNLLTEAVEFLGQIDVALVGHGVLGNQSEAELDFSVALHELRTNALSVLSLLTQLANIMEDQVSGSIIAISSVAGDRGRSSNYVYGSAKATVTTFMQGLRQRLADTGIQVLTVKPGFVDSPMTQAFDKNFLWVSPEQIAKRIVKAVERRSEVVYAPWFWRYIMLLIRVIPESLFKRADL